jgi:GNAT superfamily N-acetyltransferase
VSNEEIRNRLVNGHLAFVAYLNNEPAAFGWMATNNAKIGELNHEFYLPKGNRYLWNFRTFEAYRGKGIYPALLQYILQNSSSAASRFWIIHAPENVASLKGIRKVGFKYVGKLYIDTRNTATIESNETSSGLLHELEYMNITLSDKQASSCWNCSSPYLKKRSNTCCCAATENECVGNRLLITT